MLPDGVYLCECPVCQQRFEATVRGKTVEFEEGLNKHTCKVKANDWVITPRARGLGHTWPMEEKKAIQYVRKYTFFGPPPPEIREDVYLRIVQDAEREAESLKGVVTSVVFSEPCCDPSYPVVLGHITLEVPEGC